MTWLDTSGGTSTIIGDDVSTGDGEAQAQAVGDWLNAHGGVAARQVRLVVDGHDYAESQTDPDATMEASCRRMTEDDPVFAVAVFLAHPTLIQCLAQNDTVAVADVYPQGQLMFDQYPAHFYSPGTPSYEHAVLAEVELLVGTDYFTGDDGGVGILTFDTPAFRAVAAVLRQALEQRGISVAREFYGDASNVASGSAQLPGAVLQFSAGNVSKLMIIDSGGGMTLGFMNTAESQGYRPRYALTSGSVPRTIAPLVPPAQLQGALTTSWTPYDTEEDQATPPAVPDTRRTCQQIYQDAGIDLSDRNVELSAMSICAELLFLKATLDRAPALNSSALATVVGEMGTSFTSPMTFQTRLAADRHDGASLARLNQWGEACACWEFTGRTGQI